MLDRNTYLSKFLLYYDNLTIKWLNIRWKELWEHGRKGSQTISRVENQPKKESKSSRTFQVEGKA